MPENRSRGRPENEAFDHRPNLNQTAALRTKAILQLAAQKRGFKSFGYLLDVYAADVQAQLEIPEYRVVKQMRSLLKRLRR